MTLQQTFIAQAELQRALNAHPETMDDPEELIQYIKDMVLALQDEAHEFLQEVGWKPWATSRHINHDAAKSELVDLFQFFMNLCFAVSMSATELMELHAKKLEKNFARLENGYDGVTAKCGWCGRALDDEYTSCEASVEGTQMAWCSEKNVSHLDGFFTLKDAVKKHE